LSLLCIKYMLSGHSAAHEIKHIWKLTSGFFGPQILNFERSFSLYPGPQSSLVLPCKFSLWWPCPTSMKTINNILFRQIINLLPHYCWLLFIIYLKKSNYNLIWFDLIGWSAWRQFWLFLITCVGIMMLPTTNY
jgi:hypothetical protein